MSHHLLSLAMKQEHSPSSLLHDPLLLLLGFQASHPTVTMPCVYIKQVQCLGHGSLREARGERGQNCLRFRLSWTKRSRIGARGEPRQASCHRRRAGDALDDGAGWRAADGVEDVKRVRKNTLHAIFHRTYLEGGKNEIFRNVTKITYLNILISAK